MASLAVALGAVALQAQAPVRVEGRGGVARVVNDLPVPAAVLYRVADDSLSSHLAFKSIGARSGVELRESSGQIMLERVEPLHGRVGLSERLPAQCGGSAGAELRDAIARLESEAAAAPLEGSAAAEQAIAAASQLAQLRLERTRDSLDTERNSMVAFTARIQQESGASLMEAAAQRDKDTEESLDRTIQDIGVLAFAYSEAAAAKYDILQRDADRYRKLLAKSEEALAAVRRQLELVQRRVQATDAFERLVADSLQRGAAAAGSGAGIRVGTGVRRLCATPAGIEDQVAISGLSAGELAAIPAQIRYDGGERLLLIFRRIRGTDDWRATLQWPVDATRATVRVQEPSGRWADIAGELQAGRPSLLRSQATLEHDVKEARKRFKEAGFRAEGADHVKTVVVP